MVVSRTIEVRPFYGWGWADTADAPWDYVPEPFHANVMPKTEIWFEKPIPTLQGTVAEDRHELDGYSVMLSPRHVEWDGDVNITLQSTEGRELRGFGSIDLASFNG
jgi:hypothetical protein